MDSTSTRSTDGYAGFRALVVDDERPLASIISSYLERESFEVSVAYNGFDALALAREVDPDVVVLDLGLPGIDGHRGMPGTSYIFGCIRGDADCSQ